MLQYIFYFKRKSIINYNSAIFRHFENNVTDIEWKMKFYELVIYLFELLYFIL